MPAPGIFSPKRGVGPSCDNDVDYYNYVAMGMDVGSFWSMLNKLGTEFERLHSRERLLASSKCVDGFVQPQPIAKSPLLRPKTPAPKRPSGASTASYVTACHTPPSQQLDKTEAHAPSTNEADIPRLPSSSSKHSDLRNKPTIRGQIEAARYISESDIDGPKAQQSTSSIDKQKALIDIFDHLDADGSGSLSAEELRNALVAIGVPQARTGKIMRIADADHSGTIEKEEWIEAVRSGAPEMRRLSIHLMEKNLQDGGLSLSNDMGHKFMVRPLSAFRLLWDLIMTIVCAYIALGMPFAIVWEDAFSKSATVDLATFDRWINYLFMLDILLNFRTGYVDRHGDLVMDWKKVGKNYMRTWCLLDAISSIPTDDMQADVTGFSALKVLKLSKLLKIVRIMRPRNIVDNFSERSDFLDDIAQSKVVQVTMRKSGVFFYMLLLCHWMACGMKLANEQWLTSYQDVGGRLWSEYLTAVYWALSTMTTVGYGDIIATCDGERAFASLAMIVGGSFYGFVVGAITSVVADSDLNATAFHERFGLISAWMNHQHRLPLDLKRTIRRYFKAYLSEKSALSDAHVFADMSYELQKEVGKHLIIDDVQHNPLFDGIGIGSVVHIQSILRLVTVQAGSCLAARGEVGVAMYMLVSGSLRMVLEGEDEDGGLEEEEQDRAGQRYRQGSSDNFTTRDIVPGQSFGEEFLLGFAECNKYSVFAMEKSKLGMIQQSEFLKVFSMMPNVVERMKQNAMDLKTEWGDAEREDLAVAPCQLPSLGVTASTESDQRACI